MLTTDRNRTNLHRLNERINRGDLSIVDELVSKDYVLHTATGVEMGLDAYRKNLAAIFQIYPDFKITIESVVAEEDLVAHYFRWEGTYRGESGGRDIAGKRVTVRAMAISRFDDGKIVEEWTLHDRLGLYQQLGIVPSDRELSGNR